MHRFAVDYLKEWKGRDSRKPLVIRGARQTGKSFLVEMFAASAFETLVKIDFEKTPEMAAFFRSKTPKTIVHLLETKLNKDILPGRTLLFLDEIQAAPDIFAALRYFHEEMPQLHVIAAGSLLEFALEKHKFSMPVGRIEYLHMGPMSFEEFLVGTGREKLRRFLCDYSIREELPGAIHSELMGLLRQYLVVGGMPEAVSFFAKNNSYRECGASQQSILSTYRDDFGKYAERANPHRLEKVFGRIPALVGKKFKCSNVDRDEKARDVQQALHMLELARVVSIVRHSSCNGVPLKAEADDRKFKTLFLDVGMLCRSLGLNITEFENAGDVMLVNSGAVCEQFIGQHLLYSKELFEEPELFYWIREKENSSSEVDYVFSIGADIFPVEVKAGKSGTLKSLHMFLREKGCNFGIRFNSDVPSIMEANTNLPDGNNKPFRLLSLPLYMVGQTMRLCKGI